MKGLILKISNNGKLHLRMSVDNVCSDLPPCHKTSPVVLFLLSLICLVIPYIATAKPEESVNLTDAVSATITVVPGSVLRRNLPDTFFGFNIRWTNFQKDLWDSDNARVKPEIVDAMKPFKGALFRYPGGLVANEYIWEEAILPMDERKHIDWQKPLQDRPPLFGVDEFFDFVKQVKGTPLYTLNLVGRGKPSNIQEFPLSRITESNRELARHIVKLTPENSVRYYQLGNELDRSRYQWPHSKYIQRSLASIQAIRQVDPDAKFIAFLREFNWRYRYGKSGVSKYQDFMGDVLTGLPMVNDYSIHVYYDAEVSPGGKFLHIPDAIERISRTLAVAKKVRKSTPVNVWITEHARRFDFDRNNEAQAKEVTTNLGGAISTADFMIAMAQIPEVEGMSVQALNGVARQIFDASVKHNDLRPRPLLYAMKVLNSSHGGAVLLTRSTSKNNSGYEGGYDVRATAFVDDSDVLSVWVVNRAPAEIVADIEYMPFRGTDVHMKHYYLAGKSGVSADSVGDEYGLELDPKKESLRFSDDGLVGVTLPPSSISTFHFRRADVRQGGDITGP